MPRGRDVLATLARRCSPDVKIKVGLCHAAATLQRRCRIVPRCASLCLSAATQHGVPERIVTYNNVAETQHNVVHEFCSRSVTFLLHCRYVVPRCSTSYHVVATLWYVVGETPANFEHVQNINLPFTYCQVLPHFSHVVPHLLTL